MQSSVITYYLATLLYGLPSQPHGGIGVRRFRGSMNTDVTWQVFGGLLLARSHVAQFTIPDSVVFLWIHESERTMRSVRISLRFRQSFKARPKGIPRQEQPTSGEIMCHTPAFLISAAATLDSPAYGLVEDIDAH